MQKILSAVLAIVAFALPTFAFAASSGSSVTVDISTLPVEQRNNILQQVDEARKAREQVKATQDAQETPAAKAQAVLETANKWAEIGHAVGSTLVSTARDLGVTANDFASTPVGKIIVAIVVWKYLASDVTHIGLGLLFLVGGVTIGLSLLRRASVRTVSNEEFAHIPVFFGLYMRKKLVKREYRVAEKLRDSQISMHVVAYIVLAVSAVVSLCLI
jgi:hypothetical protein